jgi:hypothetical protein
MSTKRGLVGGVLHVQGGVASTTSLTKILDERFESLPVNELHGIVRDGAFASDGENGDDVGMVQMGGGSSLVLETLQLPGVESPRQGQNLESDPPIQGKLNCLVNDPHSSSTDLPDQAKVAQLGFSRERPFLKGLLVVQARGSGVQELQTLQTFSQFASDVRIASKQFLATGCPAFLARGSFQDSLILADSLD